MARWAIAFDLAVAVGAFCALLWAFAYPWQLAFLLAAALGALAYSTRRTVGNLRRLWGGPSDPDRDR